MAKIIVSDLCSVESEVEKLDDCQLEGEFEELSNFQLESVVGGKAKYKYNDGVEKVKLTGDDAREYLGIQ